MKRSKSLAEAGRPPYQAASKVLVTAANGGLFSLTAGIALRYSRGVRALSGRQTPSLSSRATAAQTAKVEATPPLAQSCFFAGLGQPRAPTSRRGNKGHDLPGTIEQTDRKSTRLNSSHLGISY